MHNHTVRTTARRTLGLLLAVAATTGGAVAHADAATPAKRDLRKLVHLGVPGATVLVRDADGTTVTSAGLASLKPKVKLREQPFRVGSVTKPMMAAVVLQLVQEGRLSLEQPITEIVGKLAGGDKRITIRDLLAHKSGLSEYVDDPRTFAPYLAGDFGHVWTPQQLVRIATEHKPLFAPGTKQSYSNTNYVLLGLIIEKVTGTSLSEQMETRVFDPLHMDNSSMSTTPAVPSAFVRGYLVGPRHALQDVTGVSPSVYWGAGNVASTTRDLADFVDGLLAGKLLSPTMLAAMLTMDSDSPEGGYGLGISRAKLPCGYATGHDGAVAGYLTSMVRMDTGRTVIVMANSLTLDDQVGSKRAQKQLRRLFIRAACGD